MYTLPKFDLKVVRIDTQAVHNNNLRHVAKNNRERRIVAYFCSSTSICLKARHGDSLRERTLLLAYLSYWAFALSSVSIIWNAYID